jgi:hypothetical protein
MADDGDGGICEGLSASGKVSMFGKRFFESMDARGNDSSLFLSSCSSRSEWCCTLEE